MENIVTVKRDQISGLNFYQEDVADNDEARNKRLRDLIRATTFGNGQRKKVKLIFKKLDGELNQVETTVWSVGSNFVTLKAGISMPVGAILKVDF